MSSFLDRFLSLTKTIFEVRGGNVLGKVDMQKTFYFAKELGVPVPFNFRWGKLGPYSYELSNVFDSITRQGLIRYDGSYRYDERNFQYIEEIELPPIVSSFYYEIDDICEDNGYNRIHFIECLASLHFLHKYSKMPDREATFSRLRSLKQNRMNLLDPLMGPAWQFLLDHNLLER